MEWYLQGITAWLLSLPALFASAQLLVKLCMVEPNVYLMVEPNVYL